MAHDQRLGGVEGKIQGAFLYWMSWRIEGDASSLSLEPIERFLAFEQGGVRIIKSAVERVRGQVAEVFFVEFAQCAAKGADFFHKEGGVSVGFVFVAARELVRER